MNAKRFRHTKEIKRRSTFTKEKNRQQIHNQKISKMTQLFTESKENNDKLNLFSEEADRPKKILISYRMTIEIRNNEENQHRSDTVSYY